MSDSVSHRRGNLFVISGPSGVGKGTLVKQVLEERPDTWLSVSATTRSPRPGEIDGVNYFFLTREEFEKLADDGGFIEWAQYGDNLYGTPLESVTEHLENGEDVILEIEVQGADKVRSIMDDATLIFIEPPSMEELENRLRSRDTEDEEAINKRLNTAKLELERKKEYDICLVNDDLNKAVDELVLAMDNTDR